MIEVDYLIVGCGLAGISFCEQLRLHDKTFLVIDDHSQQSSLVAAGLYNPVILKRFTAVWKAKEQLDLVLPFYARLEKLLQTKLDYQLPVYRLFASIEEQNGWFSASDKPSLEDFLASEILKNDNPSINAPYGFGKVLETGRVDTKALLQSYQNLLKENNRYFQESFLFSEMTVDEGQINYKNMMAKKIVFAEGFGMVNNPYFKELSLNVAKGEVLTIKAPDLNIDYILKSSIFIVPEGNDCYSVGATYNWDDTTNEITESAKNELLSKLDEVIACDYEVVGQVAGVRPTVKDRRPLIGTHPLHKNVAILNGLGTRGVMIGPYVAKQLYDFLENGISLDPEIDIKRFSK